MAVTEADMILVNGFGLEEFLDDLLSGSDTQAEVIVVSEGILPLMMVEHADEKNGDHEGEDPLEAVMGQDPHVWFDPNNI